MKTRKKTIETETKKELTLKFPRIYVGPSIEKLGIKHYAVFATQYPAHIIKILEKYPYLSHLIVPVSQLRQAQKDLKDKTTALFPSFQSKNPLK